MCPVCYRLIIKSNPSQFDGACLAYILKFFKSARTSYYGDSTRLQDQSIPQQLPSPLFYKQSIIVLREELEYFAVPPSKTAPSADTDTKPDEDTRQLKQLCADSLLAQRSIFTPLQRNINRENNAAEQHLIDMLCMRSGIFFFASSVRSHLSEDCFFRNGVSFGFDCTSGFNRDDEWGYRSLEPRRCCITSLALVLLNTGITHDHPPGHPFTGPVSPTQMNPQVNAAQLTTAQKLLLFWRKPAVGFA